MNVQFLVLTITFPILFKAVHSNENKVRFVYKRYTSFKEELIIANVTSDETLELGYGVRKWKSLTVGHRNYAIGMADTGIRLLTTHGESHTSVYVNITDDAIKILDVQLHKVWNATSRGFDPTVLVMLEGGSLSWFKTDENLGLEPLWTLELDKDAFQFDVYTIDKIDYLFALNRGNVENGGDTLDVYKISVISGRYKYLWPEQTINLEVPTTSFSLNNHGSNYYLSITQKVLNHVKIYKRVNRSFELQWKIPNTDSDNLKSFSIGPKTYIATNGKNSAIYRITNHGPIKEDLNETDITNWLPIPLVTYRDELFLLAQKEINHQSHTSHSIELIHSVGFNFNVYHEIPCFYYKSHLHGLDCLVEEEDHHAQLNVSAIIPFENTIGLIISREDLHSQLFVLRVDVNNVPNPRETRMKRLQEFKSKLEIMQKEIQDLKDEKEKSSLSNRSDSRAAQANKEGKTKKYRQRDSNEDVNDFMKKYKSVKETIENLKKILKESNEEQGFKIKKLIVNGNVKVEGSVDVTNVETNTLNKHVTLDVINDIYQVNNPKKISGTKVFKNLKVENIIFDRLNNVDKNEFIFNDNKTPIVLKGNVKFSKDLHVIGNITTTTKNVNNITLENELVYSGRVYDTLAVDVIEVTENLQVKNINSTPVDQKLMFDYSQEEIDGYFKNKTFEKLTLMSLKADKLNSENFAEVMKTFLMKNSSYSIPGPLEVDILNTSNITIKLMNNLTYPHDFIPITSSDNIDITGTKKFKLPTNINRLTINGLINGVNPSDIFTLSDDQHVSANINFKNLEIVQPSAEDKKIESILKTNDIINDLEVDGEVMIEENINDVNIEDYLDNFLWQNSEENIINSTKIIKDLSVDNIHVDTINNVPFDFFINKNQNQTFNIDTLQGNVTIENLSISGKIGSVDVKDLLENSVKLSGDQNISSFLTFTDLEVKNLQILEALNGRSPDEFLHSNGEKHLALEKLKNIKAREVIVKGEVFGDVEGLDVEDLIGRVLKKHGNQEISGDLLVKDLYVDHLKAGKINGYYAEELFDGSHYLSVMEQRLLDNKIGIKNLNILGSLTLGSINNIAMKDVMNSLTFTKENSLQPNITFRDNVSFNSVNIKNFNGIDFKDFLNNLIFKNESNIKINSTKIFLHGFAVNKYIETETLNRISLENVLRKENIQKIRGPIVINGNVVIEDHLELDKLNDVSLNELKDVINIFSNGLYVNNDVLFNQSIFIENLVLHGYFNGNNITEVFKNAIGLNDDVIAKGNFAFQNKVKFDKDLDVSDTFNDINLSKTYQDIVFINEDDYIEGLVSFRQPVEVKGLVNVESDLLTDTIMGINPHDWWTKGLFINQGLIPGKLMFQNVTVLSSISTEFLNDMNASRFIPLKVDQTIHEHLTMENMKANQHLYVQGEVNEVDVHSEYLNTVLNNGVQNITSKVRFNGNVLIYEDLLIKNKVNNLDFDKVVFTNQHQNLTGNYNFLSKTTGSNLEIEGLINGINFTNWYKNSLKKSWNWTQNLTGSIKMDDLVIDDYSYGKGLISGLDLRNVTDDMAYKLQYKSKIENDFITDYKAACTDVNFLLQASKKQIYKYKYLESLPSIYFEKNINLVYPFQYGDQQYVLVNEKQTCHSHILYWNLHTFVEIQQFDTGVLKQMIAVKTTDDHIYLVGKSTSNCTLERTNLWRLENKTVKYHQALEDVMLLQESLIPNTFYALNQNEAREYKITTGSNLYVHRKWKINANDNTAFVPRGLATGPALRDGQKIVKLQRNERTDVDFDHDVQEALLGDKTTEKNKIIPGRNGEMVILNAGNHKKPMVAITSREGSSIKTKSDSIKIYNDVFKGMLFQKIPTYKPSALTSLEFGNGETLLIFLEDEKLLQVYAYKGIEGFQHVREAKMRGKQIVKMRLPMDLFRHRDVLVILKNNELNLLGVVMDGNDSTNIEKLYCEL